MKRQSLKTALVAGLFWISTSGTTHAMVINGDFASFGGWDGTLIDSFTLDEVPVDPALDGGHFALGGDGTATMANDFDFFGVVLSQALMLDPADTTLQFDYAWEISDAADLVQASIVDPVTNNLLLDLFAGVDTTVASQGQTTASVDVSVLAGQSVGLEFLLLDGDFFEFDTFTVGNFELIGPTTSVSEPPAALMLLIGILALRRLRGTASS